MVPDETKPPKKRGRPRKKDVPLTAAGEAGAGGPKPAGVGVADPSDNASASLARKSYTTLSADAATTCENHASQALTKASEKIERMRALADRARAAKAAESGQKPRRKFAETGAIYRSLSARFGSFTPSLTEKGWRVSKRVRREKLVMKTERLVVPCSEVFTSRFSKRPR